jgi:ABC-2 type transport system ATP-binding protein
VSELCARRLDRYRIRVQGNPASFREDLLSEGVKLLTDNGQGDWRIAVPGGWTNIAFFQLAALHEVVIRSLVPDDETLEELFLRTVGT